MDPTPPLSGLLPAYTDPALTNTYWRIKIIAGHPVNPTNGRREPYLLLRQEEQRLIFAATVGCNHLTGSFTLDGESIAFSRVAATRMACPPPLDSLEKGLIEALAGTNRWQIQRNTLEFRDERGFQVALFEAAYR